MKRYVGIRTPDGCKVTVRQDGKSPYDLPLRLDLYEFTPCELDWGDQSCFGDGSALLAVSLLADLYSEEVARKHYYDLKMMVMSILPREKFVLSEYRIHDCIYGTGLGIETIRDEGGSS